MRDTDLQGKLLGLLEPKLDSSEALRQAVRLTALIRDQLHPVAHMAAVFYHTQPSAKLGAAPGAQIATVAASRAAQVATTTGLTAAFGAAGSVIPVVGTIVGVAVGFLVGKLFGHHANYQQVASEVANTMKVADLWQTVAGQYPGRIYTLPDLRFVWSGLLHEGFWIGNRGGGWSPGTCNVQACESSPNKGACTGCGGNQGWVTDVVDGSGVKALKTYIRAANAQGVYDPVAIVDRFVIPGWNGPQECSHCSQWFRIGQTVNPSLARQLAIDTVDALEAASNPNLPVTYGALPANPSSQAVAAIAPSATTVAIPPPTNPALAQAAGQTATGAITAGVLPAVPPSGSTVGDSSAAMLAALLAQQGVQMSSPAAQQLVGDVAAGGVQQTPQGPPAVQRVAQAGFGGGLGTWATVAAIVAGLFILARPTGRAHA